MSLAEAMISPSWSFVVIALAVIYRPQIALALGRLRLVRGPGGWEGRFDPGRRR